MRTHTELKQMYDDIRTDAVDTIQALVESTPDRWVDITKGSKLVITEYNDQECETLDEVIIDENGELTGIGRFYETENGYDISELDFDLILAILKKVEESV